MALTFHDGDRLLKAGFTRWEVDQFAEGETGYFDTSTELGQAVLEERWKLSGEIIEYLLDVKGGMTVTKGEYENFIHQYYQEFNPDEGEILNPWDWLKRMYKPSLRSPERVDSRSAQAQYDESRDRTGDLMSLILRR